MRQALLIVAAVSFPAAAQAPQAPAPQPPATQAAPQPPERRPLILELDETSRRQILSGTRSAESGSRGDSLPSLGGDARSLPQIRSGGSPYPKESQAGTTPAPY